MGDLVTKKSQSRFLRFRTSQDKTTVSLKSQEDIWRRSNPVFSSVGLLATSATIAQAAWFQIFPRLIQPTHHTGQSCLRIYNSSPLPITASPNSLLCVQALRALASPLLLQTPTPTPGPSRVMLASVSESLPTLPPFPGKPSLPLFTSPHSIHSSKPTLSPLRGDSV